ncbi:hypothetical protein POTOM_040276 [Populus tomentosa]|uniref:Uncharacterized protein n=1 Tax=Populus tomentosa TaxID=118781 RepID=A0A8X7YNY8_POPTO|nr:hypothetical protein POTOM_040276 [Populus tomentosa]
MGPQARISTRNPHQPRARTPTITSRGSHSWSFLGLEKDGVVPPSSLWKKARYGEDVIIGNLDTDRLSVLALPIAIQCVAILNGTVLGVWPESKSFSDEGLGPVPSKCRGICHNATKEGVPCNRSMSSSTCNQFSVTYIIQDEDCGILELHTWKMLP